MVIYNIIYSSPGHKTFLWNGSDFDLLENADAGKLFYSGKTYSEDQATEAILKSREAAHRIFPQDADPKIEKKEIPVHDSHAEGGHAHLMSA
jgi:hypothetical protein